MAKINWQQIGNDFDAKYTGTYCRYLSPLTKQKEVFLLSDVEVFSDRAPHITLYNKRAGELHLDYTTEAELDFAFPETRNFQHKKRALRFVRLHQRQWKKGICQGTSRVVFPYSALVGAHHAQLDEETLESAFKPCMGVSLDQAIYTIDEEGHLSVVLTPDLSLGCGNKRGEHWLWFQADPIAIIEGNSIVLKEKQFEQEVKDYLRDTSDYARTIV